MPTDDGHPQRRQPDDPAVDSTAAAPPDTEPNPVDSAPRARPAPRSEERAEEPAGEPENDTPSEQPAAPTGEPAAGQSEQFDLFADPTDMVDVDPADTAQPYTDSTETTEATATEPEPEPVEGGPADPQPDDEAGPAEPADPADPPEAAADDDEDADDKDDAVPDDAVPDEAVSDDAQGTGAGGKDDDRDRPAPRRRRLGRSATGASVAIAVLFALLGFGFAVQVRTTSSTSGLSSARQEDLVRILDDLSSREDRLRQQIGSLDAARSRLSTSGDKASVALSEAKNRTTTLGILAGTVAAQGPGVRLTISDPAHKLTAEDLLDAVEELRAAGGEAFQVGPVRIGVSSAFTDEGGEIVADGTPLDPPYVITAIGDPGTLATALNIPGGVVESVRNNGGQAAVVQEDHITISALRTIKAPDYASPATPKGGK